MQCGSGSKMASAGRAIDAALRHDSLHLKSTNVHPTVRTGGSGGLLCA